MTPVASRVPAELIATGDELMSGAISDTNGAWAAVRLREAGLTITRMTVVGDAQPDIEAALAEAASRVDVVVVCGGLGPTEDDRTAAAAARVAGVPLVHHAGARSHVEQMFQRLGVAMTANNLKQADLPESCELLDNPVGTAVGFAVSRGTARLFFLPGVPHEYRKMLEEQVIPRVADRTGVRLVTRVLHVYGYGESKLETVLAGVSIPAGVELGYRAAYPEIHLRLYASGSAVAERLDSLEAEIRSRLGHRLYGRDTSTLAEVLGERLVAKEWTLGLAESCTGGLASALCTDVPGASRWFHESVVTYSNAAKTSSLGVPAPLIEQHGAVSEAVARAMAEGMRSRSPVHFAAAITGIAGPDGGTTAKPVGTVWIALAGPDGTTTHGFRFRGDRDRIRRGAAFAALERVRRAALGVPDDGSVAGGLPL